MDPNIFDEIVLFHRNKHYFMAFDKLFLEKYVGAHFCQDQFPMVSLIVL
jgi:hypothetical protein